MESKDRDSRWKKTGKKIISYFKYAAKQCTIHVLETRSKHIPLLTKQRNFIRRIVVVRYFSNIIKVPFWPSFEDMRQRLWLLFKKTSKCIISETENWRQNCCHFLVLCFVIIYEQKFSLYSLFLSLWDTSGDESTTIVTAVTQFTKFSIKKKKVQQSSRDVLQKTWVSHYKIH